MKRWKKVLLVLLVITALAQVPFAYRRYQLGKLNRSIQDINGQRKNQLDVDDFVEYKGVFHVHSFLGGHTTGTFAEIIAAAKTNGLDFVVMTEHTERNYVTSEMTLKGFHDGVLFINGNEVVTASGDRLLLIPGNDLSQRSSELSTDQVLTSPLGIGSVKFITYPGEFRAWDAVGSDGIELYNVYTDAREISAIRMFFDGLWSYRSYPDLLFAMVYKKPVESLKKWDEVTSKGTRMVAIAGNDAHANVGLTLQDGSGKTLLGIQLDPYQRSFRLVRVHVLIPKDLRLNSDSLLAAVRAGRAFVGFDLFGDTSGFRFTAMEGDQKKMQGDEVQLAAELKLHVKVPISTNVVLLRNGHVVQKQDAVNQYDFIVREPGSYRVEVYLKGLPLGVSEKPWIISNPIYIR